MAVTLATGMACVPGVAQAQSAAQPPGKPRPPAPTTRPGVRPAPVQPPSRGFVTLGAGAQTGATDFSETHSEPLYGEQKTWTADYAHKTALEIEGGAGWRIWRNLFVGATYSYSHDSGSADVSAEIPHPFFFDQPRSVSGESAALSHDEHAVHISATWIVPVGRRFEVAVFGGPSVIAVSRELVQDVEYTDSYPYDTATFSQATVGAASKTGIGVHGGFGLTWLLNRQVGVGGSVRYSRASLDLSTPSGGSASFDAGGLQAAVAIKIQIAGKTPVRAPTRPAPPRNTPTGILPGADDDPFARGFTTGAVAANAPVFLRADATLTPLRQLPTGTRVRVLDQTTEWLHIEFEDRQYGRRVGYIQKAFVRIDPPR